MQPGYKSPVSRVLRSSSLEQNYIGSNTKPYLVNCDGVCQVDFLMVLFDSGLMCNNRSKKWDCRLNELEKKLNGKTDPTIMRMPITKSYGIIQPPNLNCDAFGSLLGLSSCLEQSNLENPPIEVIIEIKVQNGESIYIKEQYWPPIINTTITVINTVEDNASVPTWVIIICIALSLAVIAIIYSAFQNLRWKSPGLEP